jgi:putative transposase
MRLPRQLVPDEQTAIYHVTARINLDEFLFAEDAIKQMFLDILQEARDRKEFRFVVMNFCIMSNHIHLMLRLKPGESLSKLMQWVLSVFAMRFNREFKRRGHVWYDRFKSEIVDNRFYEENSFGYIARNPVKAGIVQRPEDYKYNGITAILNGDFSLIEKPRKYLLKKVWVGTHFVKK